MSLPKLVTPIYEVQLVSVPKPVKFRPYLAKEEKLLLMAKQSDTDTDIDRAVKQIITACTDGAVDPDTLASFDLEYLFLQLRAKSVNNIVEITYECQAPSKTTPDGICHTHVPVAVDLDTVRVVVPSGHTNKIMITKDVGVTLKYPVAKHYTALNDPDADIIPLVVECLDTVFTADGEVVEVAEQSPKDVLAFVESMSVTQLGAVRAFFHNLPALTHTVQFKCPKCGYTEDIVLSGLADFFD